MPAKEKSPLRTAGGCIRRLQQFSGLPIDVTAADRNHNIAGLGMCIKILGNLFKGSKITRVMRFLVDPRNHIPGMHNAGIDFSSRIDVRNKHFIRICKTGNIFAEQRPRTRIAVALEHTEDPFVRNPCGRLQRCRDFVRMMTVIVENLYAVFLAEQFKPALRIDKAMHCIRIRVKRCTEPFSGRICRDCIDDIMLARNG